MSLYVPPLWHVNLTMPEPDAFLNLPVPLRTLKLTFVSTRQGGADGPRSTVTELEGWLVLVIVALPRNSQECPELHPIEPLSVLVWMNDAEPLPLKLNVDPKMQSWAPAPESAPE